MDHHLTRYPRTGIIPMARTKRVPGEKPLFWTGSRARMICWLSRTLLSMRLVQFGGKHPNAKPWRGQGPGVFEVVEDYRADTYRAAYTVNLRMLSMCSMGSRRSRTMRCDMAKRRNKSEIVPSSGNVFADLGIRNREERKTKVRLAVAINQIIQGRRLSQAAAARRLKVNQPKVSALSNYRLDGFSVERLMNFVTALDCDVDIVIRRAPRSRKGGRIRVTAA